MGATVTGDWNDVLDDQRHAAAEADRARAAAAQASAPVRSGAYAASIHPVPQAMAGDVITGGLAADTPYAGVLEVGKNVGPRRGPHMAGQHVIERAGDAWADDFERDLGSKF